jgi:HEAT repeat protein
MFAALLALVLGQAMLTPVFPQPLIEQPAKDYLEWPGFGYLPPAGRKVEGSFFVPGDWSAVAAGSTSLPVAPAVWHLRVFVLRRVDRVRTLADGTLYEDQGSLETPDLDRINRAVGLLQQIVRSETGGALKIEPQITVDSEPLIVGPRTLEQAIGDYVSPRANGGKYEAEDKIYRGPYQSIFVLDPVHGEEIANQTVNGMEVQTVSVYGRSGYEVEGALALELAQKWAQSVQTMSRTSGVLGALDGVPLTAPVIGLLNPLAFVPEGDWNALMAGADLSAVKIDARERLKWSSQPDPSPMVGKLMGTGFKGVTSQVALDSDPSRGSILVYSEKGEARNGGLDFPSGEAGTGVIDPTKTSTLSFWVESNSKDPLALEMRDSQGKSYEVSLGIDLPGTSPIIEADFNRDGAWRQIKLDLKKSGLGTISQLRLVPTPNSLQHPKITLGPIRYGFAAFETSNDVADPLGKDPDPDPNSSDPWARARWAHVAPDSPKLAALIEDPEWMVRLNAIKQYIAKPDASTEAALTENATLAIDGPVSAAAQEALWNLATPTSKAVVHRTITIGVSDQGKAEAAKLIGETKDTHFASELIVLQQDRSLNTRLAAVDALANLPGANATIIRMSFIYEENPQLRLEVTKTSDPNDPYQWKIMLWSAVNESSDAVRLESCEKLIASTDPMARAGGYVGVKDDSLEVRIQLLRFLEQHPSENNRDPLRQAVADRSAKVRAAAIRAFAVLEKGVKPDELGAALQDGRPVVQLALIDLALDKKIDLPQDVCNQMASSPDPEVQQAYKAIHS